MKYVKVFQNVRLLLKLSKKYLSKCQTSGRLLLNKSTNQEKNYKEQTHNPTDNPTGNRKLCHVTRHIRKKSLCLVYSQSPTNWGNMIQKSWQPNLTDGQGQGKANNSFLCWD
jgi:hypothetical protein